MHLTLPGSSQEANGTYVITSTTKGTDLLPGDIVYGDDVPWTTGAWLVVSFWRGTMVAKLMKVGDTSSYAQRKRQTPVTDELVPGDLVCYVHSMFVMGIVVGTGLDGEFVVDERCSVLVWIFLPEYDMLHWTMPKYVTRALWVQGAQGLR